MAYRLATELAPAPDMIYGSGLRSGDFNLDHLPGYGQVNLGMSREIAMPGRQADHGALRRASTCSITTYEIRDGTGIGVFAPQFGPRRGFFVGASQKL